MPNEPCQEELEHLPAVPPSAQTVFCTLFGHEPMTGAQLRTQTGLPRRTVYSALRRLRDLGLVAQQVSLRDTRQTYFWLKDSTPVLHA